MERYEKLLEVYTLEEIIDALGLEQVEVLQLLDEQGYLQSLELPEAL
jgi:hypothetical protein